MAPDAGPPDDGPPHTGPTDPTIGTGPPDPTIGTGPIDVPGGPHGALVVHGFTGSPQSVEGVARALAATGLAVRAPLLAGHGTSVDDLIASGWDDWWAAADTAYRELAATVDRVVVFGLSMGGTLATALAAAHPEVAGIVVVNPYVEPPATSFRELLQGLLDADVACAPGIGSDIADPDAQESSYKETPIAPILSLCEALDRLLPRLPEVACPVLLMTSRVDHVVPTESSDLLAERVSGPVERVWLENSFHVATLDHDRHEVERRAVEFAAKVTWRG